VALRGDEGTSQKRTRIGMLYRFYNKAKGYEINAIYGKYSRRNCDKTELAKGTSIGHKIGINTTAQGREKGDKNNELSKRS
jgi:hypothetical protein